MTNKNIGLRVCNPNRKYALGGPHEQYHTFRDEIINLVKAPFKRFNRAPSNEEFWALKG